MSDFDSSGKGGKRGSKGASVWGHLRTIGQGVLDGFAGGSKPAATGGKGVQRSVSRQDPLTSERRVAASQVKRSLRAWRDRQDAEGGATGVQRKPQIPSGGGAPLPGAVKSKMEGKLGADLSDVKIHTGGDSEKASEDLNAKAFTIGNDVHFGSGQFDPSSKEGEKLIAHELTHVVQGQRGGGDSRGGDAQRAEENKTESEGEAPEGADGEALEVSNPDEPAEKEADEVSEKVVEGDESAVAMEGTGDHDAKRAQRKPANAATVKRKVFRAENPDAPWERLAEEKGTSIGATIPADAAIQSAVAHEAAAEIATDATIGDELTQATARALTSGTELQDYLQLKLTGMVKTTASFAGYAAKTGVTNDAMLTELRAAAAEAPSCNEEAISAASPRVCATFSMYGVAANAAVTAVRSGDSWLGQKDEFRRQLTQALTAGGVPADKLENMLTLGDMAAEDVRNTRIDALGTSTAWMKDDATVKGAMFARIRMLAPTVVETAANAAAAKLKPRTALSAGVNITRYGDKHLIFLGKTTALPEAKAQTKKTNFGQYWVPGQLTLEMYNNFVKATLENGDEFEGDGSIKVYDGSCAGISATGDISSRHRAEVSSGGESHGHPH